MLSHAETNDARNPYCDAENTAKQAVEQSTETLRKGLFARLAAISSDTDGNDISSGTATSPQIHQPQPHVDRTPAARPANNAEYRKATHANPNFAEIGAQQYVDTDHLRGFDTIRVSVTLDTSAAESGSQSWDRAYALLRGAAPAKVATARHPSGHGDEFVFA